MYFGEHSIRFYPDESRVGTFPFDSKENQDDCPDTWDRWHLIPTGKVIFQPPEHKQNLLEIPGRHGLVNVNKYTFGRPVFGARTGDIEFILDPDYIEDWPAIYSDMLRYFHGQERCAVLRDDRYFFYKGFFDVSDLTPDESWDTVKLTYTLDPFKYERWTSVEPWFWDDFDFRQGVIRNTQDITVTTVGTNSHAMIFPAIQMPVALAFKRSRLDEELPAIISGQNGLQAFCSSLPSDETEAKLANFDDISAELTSRIASYFTGQRSKDNGYRNDPLDGSANMLLSAIAEVKRLCDNNAPDDDIKIAVDEMQNSAYPVPTAAIGGLLQASTSQGGIWYNVYYDDYTPVPELTLMGEGYPKQEAMLYFKGSGTKYISIRLRGGTL